MDFFSCFFLFIAPSLTIFAMFMIIRKNSRFLFHLGIYIYIYVERVGNLNEYLARKNKHRTDKFDSSDYNLCGLRRAHEFGANRGAGRGAIFRCRDS